MFSGQSAIQLTRFAVAAASYVSVRGYLESGAAFLKMMLPMEVLSGFGQIGRFLATPILTTRIVFTFYTTSKPP